VLRTLLYWKIDTDTIRIVLVPDASTSHHDRLADSAWDWLQPLVEQASLKAVYYELQYEPEHKDSEVWQALSNVGDALLNEFLKQEQEGRARNSAALVTHILTSHRTHLHRPC
jgi:hypothetical protein